MSDDNKSNLNNDSEKINKEKLKERTEYVKKRMNVAQQKFERDFKNASKNNYKVSEPYQIDKEGFTLIDQQYQKEVTEARRKITEKWTVEFQKKEYVGSREAQNKAREFDKEQRNQKIADEFENNRQKIELFHFGEERRDDIFKRFQNETISKKNKETLEQKRDKVENSHEQNQMLKNHDAKNIYELARKIVLKQQDDKKKNRSQ